MIVGHNHHRLERRITAALLSGIPYPREAYFLQQMSERILHKGNNTWLSDRQAERLFTILVRCEKEPSPTPKRPPHPSRLPSPQPRGPEPFHIEECFIDPQAPPQHSSTQPDNFVVLPAPTLPTPPPPEPLPAREPGSGDIIKRIITRNENLRKRRERIERQYLKSSSTSLDHRSPLEFLRK